jgi:Antibiotic biosynthesis monooxygenase
VIVRVLRARVRAGRVAPFNALFRRQLALLREQEGLLYVKLARRLQRDGGEEAVLFEEWQDAASLYAWVGPNLTEPRLVPGVRELVDEIHVAHYEALSEDEAAPGDDDGDAAREARVAGERGSAEAW